MAVQLRVWKQLVNLVIVTVDNNERSIRMISKMI